MSETKQRNPDEDEACRVTCPDCHLTIVHERPRPAEPVIEHPAVPTHTCSDCYAPIWSTGNGWRDRLSFRCYVREDGGHRPAVPAQEAPRDVKCGNCGWLIWRKEWARNNWYCPTCHPATEPQAGARVPSQEYELSEISARTLEIISASPFYSKVEKQLAAALEHIVAYAAEAAKTSITREDMHDPLKAQTFYDEHEGFIRLVLSEIGGSK